MRKAVTLRLDPGLLAQARRCAIEENRTLTNLIETMIKQRVGAALPKRTTEAPSEDPMRAGTSGAS